MHVFFEIRKQINQKVKEIEEHSPLFAMKIKDRMDETTSAKELRDILTDATYYQLDHAYKYAPKPTLKGRKKTSYMNAALKDGTAKK